MTGPATPLLVERINRLGIAVAELMDLHARQNHALLQAIRDLGSRLDRVEDRLMGVERALHALRASTRLDERKDFPAGTGLSGLDGFEDRIDARFDRMKTEMANTLGQIAENTVNPKGPPP